MKKNELIKAEWIKLLNKNSINSDYFDLMVIDKNGFANLDQVPDSFILNEIEAKKSMNINNDSTSTIIRPKSLSKIIKSYK